MKLSDYVVDVIADAGAKHVFMLAGGGAMHLNDSLGRSNRLEFACNLHEQACAIAAEAYGQFTITWSLYGYNRTGMYKYNYRR